MADRGMTTAMIQALEARQQAPVHLLELHFDEGVDYSTDAPRNIVWNGNTYVGLGHLLGFEGIQETGELVINRVTVTLSAVDKTKITDFQTKSYIDRDLKIYLAMLDSSLQVISQPLLIFHGRMDAPRLVEDPEKGSSVASIDAVPIWSETGRAPGRHTNHEEQQYWFAGQGDLGFEYVSEVPKTILWGRA